MGVAYNVSLIKSSSLRTEDRLIASILSDSYLTDLYHYVRSIIWRSKLYMLWHGHPSSMPALV